jgi:predicted Zn-dependent protease
LAGLSIQFHLFSNIEEGSNFLNCLIFKIMKQYFSIAFLIMVVSISVFFVYSCSRVPLTGRQQLTWIPSQELLNLSFQSYQQMMGQAQLSNNQQQAQLVREVGTNIGRAVEEYMRSIDMADALEGYQWEFNLLAGDEVNAWAMPGGKVAFYEGIMPICRDENGVAVVMGHEIAHAIAEHGNERLTHGLIQQGLGTALSIALRNEPQQTQQLLLAVYGAGSTVFGILPYSRLHESEADQLGLIFMAMAGYDPREAPEFWSRMAAASGGGQPPKFLSTHPPHGERIENLNSRMPEAMQYYREYGRGRR